MTGKDITNKLWNYCNFLRDDGMSYGDYVEQLTYLLFLKEADKRILNLTIKYCQKTYSAEKTLNLENTPYNK